MFTSFCTNSPFISSNQQEIHLVSKTESIIHCTIKMQFTTIITALSFGLGAHAWAQAGNGEWITNDTKYYGFENARKSTLNQGLLKQPN